MSYALPTYRMVIPRLLDKQGYGSELEGMRGILAVLPQSATQVETSAASSCPTRDAK